MKIILFIDALDPRDVEEYCPEMLQDMAGRYDVGVPRVTPNTVSQAVTGLPPGEMQMLRSTPQFEPSPEGGYRTGSDGEWQPGERRVGLHRYPNLFERLDDEGVRVFQYGTPFCATIDLENGLSVYDEMTVDTAPEWMNFASPPTSFQEDDWDLIADTYLSETVLKFETIKQVTRQDTVDVIHLGYKHIDHCTHWHAPEIKRDLIRVLWEYVKELREMGHEVMWWSDHGSHAKHSVFRVNKFLAEQGFLDYEIDTEFLAAAEERGMVNRQFGDQLGLDHQLVEIEWDNSVAFSSDAFDSMVDVTPHASEEEIGAVREALAEHPAVKNVWRKHEYLDPDSENYWYHPELIVERDDHVLVTGNVDPDAATWIADVPDDWQDFPEENMGVRSGVHSRWGCYGGDIPSVNVSEPHELHDVMWSFVDPDSITSDDGEPDVKQVEDAPRDRLEALGYL